MSKIDKKEWQTYEEVATYLLNQFAEHFELGRVEAKQVLPGESGTEWEIDAKGIAEDEIKYIVVECKMHTKSGVSQAIAGSLAFTIKDVGASGGILVSPLGLQEGAKKVAKAAGITEVILKENSTTTDYVFAFLNTLCVGISDAVNTTITETLVITETDSSGKIIKIHNIQ